MDKAQQDALLPCPFCGEHLKKMSEAQGYFHSKKNCVLSDFHMEADGYSEERWNTRTPDLQADNERLRADKARLDYLQDESNDVRSVSLPTGGDDADIGWQVIAHYQAQPCERVVGENFSDDIRAAIDDAMNRAALTTTNQEEPNS